jgi:hypothetical protein
MREGFTLRREIGWYPSEDKYQLCNPGGKFRAKISYTGEDVKYYAPNSSGREVQVAGPPTSSAFELIPDVFDVSINVPIQVASLVGNASGGFIQADTKEGRRQFHSAITEARVQGAAGTNVISEAIQAASDVVDAVKSGVVGTLKYLASGVNGSVGGIKNCPVPAEFVGHIRIYTEREGWFSEGSDMNDRYSWVWAKAWMWQHVYTLNYADWLTGKARWKDWLDLRRTDNQQAEMYLYQRNRYETSRLPPELRLPYYGHPFHNWADYHHYPITALPPDVRTLRADVRRRHYVY